MSLVLANPKIQAVSGLGELVEEAVEALRDCLNSETEEVKFAAAKYVMEKMATPKAVHTILDPKTVEMLTNSEMSGVNSVVEACSRGDCTIEEAQAFLDLKKNHLDISRQQASLDQIARIKALEDRKAKLITLKTDAQRLEEAMV